MSYSMNIASFAWRKHATICDRNILRKNKMQKLRRDLLQMRLDLRGYRRSMEQTKAAKVI